MFGWGRKRKLKHCLDDWLLRWTQYEPYRCRSLLDGGILICGRSGSGKTSSSGRVLGQAIVNNRNFGGLILGATPYDLEMWMKIFGKAGRLKDLIVFDEHGSEVCNLLDFIGKGQTRNVVNYLSALSQCVNRTTGSRSGDSEFWEEQRDRANYNAIAGLQAAKEPVSAPNIHRFIMTAAGTLEALSTPEWQAGYQSKVLERGYNAGKTKREAHDYMLCRDFWVLEWPVLAEKTRSGIRAHCMGLLHVYNVGLVREKISAGTTVSPRDILNGKWVFVNFPPSQYGAAGVLLSSAWKFATELAILERKVDDDSPCCVIWSDEFSTTCNKPDANFICQCRSRKGCLVALLQSVASIYAAMPGEEGKHFADALLANFSHTIIHASDPVTAKWASAKLGRRMEVHYGGSSSPRQDAMIWDLMFGQQSVSSSFNMTYEQVLQDQEFMIGRTGGPLNDFLTDAILIRSGESFADGNNYKRLVFSQRG